MLLTLSFLYNENQFYFKNDTAKNIFVRFYSNFLEDFKFTFVKV